MTTANVLDHLAQRLPAFQPAGAPVPLTGGLLNRVWRVEGAPASVIVKHAPDHLGDLPLDPFRLTIESRALDLLEAQGEALGSSRVRAPRLLDFDAESHTLVMEDMGPLPALDAWLRTATPQEVARRGAWLGAFIGRLHHSTSEDLEIATRFDNPGIQQARLAVQYRSIGASLARAGVLDAASLGHHAEALGERLLHPGRCLVMGDLWPRSALIGPDVLHVIDWEMAHFGQPFQDYAHLAAHLWMLTHRGVPVARDFAWGFSEAYEREAPPEQPDEAREGALHAGCEVAVRVLGPFREGYLYEGLDASHAVIRDALARAVRWMREGVSRRADLFDW